MFELFDSLINKRDYFKAGSVLSSLGSMFTNKIDPVLPGGFQNAQVQIVSLDKVLHVFLVLDTPEDWWAAPGDTLPTQDYEGFKMLCKNLELPPVWDTEQYNRVISIHFLYLHNAQPALLVA
jgi:hypothetical protein